MTATIKKLLPLLVFLVFCGGVAVGVFYKTKTAPPETKAFQRKDPEVTVITLKEEVVPVEEEFPGRVVATRIAEVRPQVGGLILKRLFQEGSNVTEGTPLYQIDARTFQTNLERAQADLEKAKTNHKLLQTKNDRYAELIKADGISQQEFDDVKASLLVSEANIKVAEASLADAKVMLEYTKITAPISGRISKSFVNEGSLVTPNQMSALATITQFDQVYVDINQSTSDFFRLREKITNNNDIVAKLFLDGKDDAYEENGVLQFSEVLVERSTGSLQLRVVFDNKKLELLPGLFVKIRLQLGEQKTILVPQRATTRNPDGQLLVWVVDENDTAKQVVVDSKRTYGDKWLATGGVKSGDRIVYKGYQRLTSQNVKVKPLTESGE